MTPSARSSVAQKNTIHQAYAEPVIWIEDEFSITSFAYFATEQNKIHFWTLIKSKFWTLHFKLVEIDWFCLFSFFSSLSLLLPKGVNWPVRVPTSYCVWAPSHCCQTVTHLHLIADDKLPPCRPTNQCSCLNAVISLCYLLNQRV